MNDTRKLNMELLPVERHGAAEPVWRHGGNGQAHPKTARMSEQPQSKSRARREPAAPAIDAWCFLEIILKRWRWLALSACLTALLALAGGLVGWKKTCMATAQLLRYEPMAVGDFFKPAQLTQDTFSSLLKSPELLEQVSTNAQPPVSTELLAKIVFIKTDPDSDIVKVAVKGRNPQATVDLANLYARQAVAFTRELQRREADAVSQAYLKKRLEQMDKDVGVLETQFRTLPHSAQLSRSLNHLGNTVSNLNLASQSPARLSGVSARQMEKLQTEMDELSNLTKKYTDEHPLVQRQRASIEELQHRIARAATNSVADGSDTSALRADGTSAGELFNPDYEIIRAKLQALSNSRQVLADRQQEAQSFAADPPGNVRFFAPATLKNITLDRRWLKVSLATVFGGIFGLVGAVAGVLLLELIDNRLKTAADVQRVTKLPVIATLGELRDKTPAALEQWAFRTWTMLQGRLSPSSNHGLVCAFTSSQAGEGRSTWINLLADAASLSGFRVLTIATRPSLGNLGSAEKLNDGNPGAHSTELDPGTLMTNALAHPTDVTQQLTGPDARPSVHIPLPGWVWNLDRRKQWHEALKHWRSVDNLVIFVELPPASISEAVLLGENLPNLVWLTGSGQAEAAETRTQLETLRHARCNLVGAVLNREPSPPLKNRFPRWLTCLALGLVLGTTAARAQETNLPPAPIPEIQNQTSTNGSFSITSPAQRSEWQKRLTLGPGDVLGFALYGQPELTRSDVIVGPDGRVNFLDAQNILATGLTIDELRTNVDQELGKYLRSPRTIITPVAFRSKRYYMLGRVVQRGVYVLDRPLTLLEAVARAHGLETGISGRNSLELADFQRSFLIRHGQRIPLDFEKLFVRGDLSQNIPVEPDDYFYFPPANVQEVYVLGEVRLPGVVPYTHDLTVVGALSARGGFTDAAYKTHVVVIRGSLRQPKTFVVDTWAIFDARGQDFKLEPKDIIFVSGRPFLRGEQLLDLAATAFIQSVTAEWTGAHIGPIIHPGIIPGP